MDIEETLKNGMWDKLGGDLLNYEYEHKKSCSSISLEFMFGRKPIKNLSLELQNFINNFFEYEMKSKNISKEELIKRYMIEDLV